MPNGSPIAPAENSSFVVRESLAWRRENVTSYVQSFPSIGSTVSGVV